ncbi:acetyltransferase [Apiospora arundinis]
MWLSSCVASSLLFLGAYADPTWPSRNDELEEIMYQVQSVNTRGFGGTVIPCSSEAAGPGRQNAAEWLRTAFHDMASANLYFKTGGLDGSLQFETGRGENTGPGFNTSLQFYSNYYTSRSSVSDLIALGLYYAVRSCGGPAVPIRGGRIDATTPAPDGQIPQPQNSLYTFQQQFSRLGFSVAGMIQLVACGHTLGGVHSPEFDDIVPSGTPKGELAFDSTVATFDNKVVTEFLNNTTTNPLVVGRVPVKNSDGRIFMSDQNQTVSAMADPVAFQSTCQQVLQQMIEVVPPGVVLTDPILPYFVKPVGIQLTLDDYASTITLTGSIRVRTTNLPASSINSLTLTYKDRDGGNACGSTGCSTTVKGNGVTQGFDDTFFWFPFTTTIPVATGISSFTVALNLANGTMLSFNNNGASYPITDGILLQKPQSCFLQTPGQLTVTAAVRNDLGPLPVTLSVTNQIPSVYPVATLVNNSMTMIAGECVGVYTFYTANYIITGGMAGTAKIDVTSGSGSTAITDAFNNAFELNGTCRPFSKLPSLRCGMPGNSSSSITPPSSSTSSSASTSSSTPNSGSSSVTSSTSMSSTTSSTTQAPSSTSQPSPTSTRSSAQTSSTAVTTPATKSTTSSSAAATPTQKMQVGTYSLVGCYKEATDDRRALNSQSMAVDTMTPEICAKFCSNYHYFGTEYGRECYCGNMLDTTSTPAQMADCSMACAGDKTTYCGSGLRLDVYFSNMTTGPTQPPIVGKYNSYGCQTEGTMSRALNANRTASSTMTLETCAAFCDGYTYFGTEYSSECYCGNSFTEGSVAAETYDCSMACAGDVKELCGGPDRLSVYTTKGSSKLVSVHQQARRKT